jgi:hypothetical protein
MRVGDVRYEFRVKGHGGDAELVAREQGLEVATAPTRTVLRCRVPDQPALAGLLAWIQLLGLELIEVRRLPRSEGR